MPTGLIPKLGIPPSYCPLQALLSCICMHMLAPPRIQQDKTLDQMRRVHGSSHWRSRTAGLAPCTGAPPQRTGSFTANRSAKGITYSTFLRKRTRNASLCMPAYLAPESYQSHETGLGFSRSHFSKSVGTFTEYPLISPIWWA